MKPLMAGLLVVTLGLAVVTRAQGGLSTVHPAAGAAHSAPANAHPAASDPHPAKADPHPAASADIHPAFSGYVPEPSIEFVVAPQIAATNSAIATTPAPAETFVVPTFVDTSENQLGQ